MLKWFNILQLHCVNNCYNFYLFIYFYYFWFFFKFFLPCAYARAIVEGFLLIAWHFFMVHPIWHRDLWQNYFKRIHAFLLQLLELHLFVFYWLIKQASWITFYGCALLNVYYRITKFSYPNIVLYITDIHTFQSQSSNNIILFIVCASNQITDQFFFVPEMWI